MQELRSRSDIVITEGRTAVILDVELYVKDAKYCLAIRKSTEKKPLQTTTPLLPKMKLSMNSY